LYISEFSNLEKPIKFYTLQSVGKKIKSQKKFFLSPEYFIEKRAGPSPTPAGLKRRGWSFVAIHAPCLVLYGSKRPFLGASTCIEALFGHTEASIRVDTSIWGVNSY